MKTFAYPSPGTVDITFTPHADCVMLYTEQLSWYLLKLYELANLSACAVTTMEYSEEITPVDFASALDAISDSIDDVNVNAEDIDTRLTSIATNTSGLVTAINDLFGSFETFCDLFGDFSNEVMGENGLIDQSKNIAAALGEDGLLEVVKNLYNAYDLVIDDSGEGAPIDGIADIIAYASGTTTSFVGWLISAFAAVDAEEVLPAIPAILAIAKVVPAKWALIAKVALAVIPQMLMSYIKGKLENPDINVNIDTSGLNEILGKAFLDDEGDSIFRSIPLSTDMCVEFIDANEKRIRVFPGWNVVDVT